MCGPNTRWGVGKEDSHPTVCHYHSCFCMRQVMLGYTFRIHTAPTHMPRAIPMPVPHLIVVPQQTDVITGEGHWRQQRMTKHQCPPACPGTGVGVSAGVGMLGPSFLLRGLRRPPNLHVCACIPRCTPGQVQILGSKTCLPPDSQTQAESAMQTEPNPAKGLKRPFAQCCETWSCRTKEVSEARGRSFGPLGGKYLQIGQTSGQEQYIFAFLTSLVQQRNHCRRVPASESTKPKIAY